jgi:magnesium transporter
MSATRAGDPAAAAHSSERLSEKVRRAIRERRLWDVRVVLRQQAAADVAETLSRLEPEQAALAFRVLPRELAGEAFAELAHDQQQQLIEELGTRAEPIVEAMGADDRAALVEELPPSVARRLLAALTPADRGVTQAILGYPPESVGRVMTPDYVRARPYWTIERVLQQVRDFGRDAETISYVYVTDDEGRLVDDVSIRRILLADPGQRLESVMNRSFRALSAFDDREEAVRKMARYYRGALPVVDSQGVLVGIVTADDVADIAEQEATEDIQKQAGMAALEAPYIRARFGEMLRKRLGWLMLLFVGQLSTVVVLDRFESQLTTTLVLFIPLIIASGGNSGTQVASLLVRALALRELGPIDWVKVLRREAATGALIGAALGAFGFGVVLMWHALGVAEAEQPLLVAATVALAIAGIVVWAVVLGAMLPLALHRLGLDPATLSSPLVATLMDVSGLLIYMSVAVLLMRTSL